MLLLRHNWKKEKKWIYVFSKGSLSSFTAHCDIEIDVIWDKYRLKILFVSSLPHSNYWRTFYIKISHQNLLDCQLLHVFYLVILSVCYKVKKERFSFCDEFFGWNDANSNSNSNSVHSNDEWTRVRFQTEKNIREHML